MAILTTAGITFGDSTTQTTAAVVGVASLNGQTGAITSTSVDAIGSYVLGGGAAGTAHAQGATTAGSNLRSQASFPVSSRQPGAIGAIDGSGGETALNLNGTYRCMMSNGNASPSPSQRPINLWVRIS